MNNSAVTLEGDILLINQLELVSPTTVAGTLYGISFTLFCLYVHATVPRLRDRDRKKQAGFMLAHSLVIMLVGLYYLVANAWITQDAYIKHGGSRGGPYFYELTTFHSPVIILCFGCQLVVDTLTSAIQIWRVWVVWSATKYAKLAIVLPSLCFLTFMALKLRSIILETTLSDVERQLVPVKTGTAEVAIQGATTLLCTALISLLLVFQQWRQRKFTGEGQGSAVYMRIVAMLIEAYALESMWLLIVVILSSQPVGVLFSETKTYIEIIAYLLVQYQVASGKAYESQRGQSQMDSLRWNHSNHAMMQFVEVTEAGKGYDVSVKPGTPKVLQLPSISSR